MKNATSKKTMLAVTALAVCLPLAIGFTACDNDTPEGEKTVTGISLSYNTGDTYVVGETVQENNNILKLTYDDGSTATIPASSAGVTVTGDTSTTGAHTGTLSYEGFSIDFDYTVYPALESTIDVTGGAIRGYTDGKIEIYKGIPYAAPPVGDLRWHSPRDVEPWDGVLECYHFGPAPIQNVRNNDDYLINPWDGTSEDCLTMSVWTSGTETADKPVLVYIYGGGNTAGGTSVPIYDGSGIAEKDVVYVSFNYRLGIYGFLATDELEAEQDGCGNFALLDQVKALQWVQDNIEAFGGDKNNVTIMGQSAGAMNIESLIVSPLATGLFQNAAIMSGGIATFIEDADTVDALKYASSTGDYTLAQLRAMTTEELDANVRISTTTLVGASVSTIYDNYFLTYPSLHEALAAGAGSSKDVNLLIGTVTGDGALYVSYRDSANMTQQENTIAQRNLFIQSLLAGGGTGSSWLYYYDYIQGTTAQSAGHTDDVTFWLNNTTLKYGEWTATDALVADLLSDYLVNFCKTGDPNGEGLPVWTESTGDYGYMYLHGVADVCEYTALSSSVISAFEAAYSDILP